MGRTDIRDFRKSDFTIVEAMLIGKSDIRLTLDRKGLDKGHLIDYSRKIRGVTISGVPEKDKSRAEAKLVDGVKII